ncbi:hypothetical protein AC579_5288 [Pseudocercospora musae]|uniref:Uncharacterized protein n=1 Tax=Pseudocercospora musae TaxID=113226 RepID=A0A139IQ49_9PEZI|nr:hypothetical protein AC579_5288 [Pseudocercospora musae]
MIYMPIPRGTEVVYTMDDGVTYKGKLSADFYGMNNMGVGHITLDPGWCRTYIFHRRVSRDGSDVPITVQYRRGDRMYYWSPNN